MLEVNITNENFQSEVMRSNIPVFLDFYADWCGPCKMLMPIVEEIAKEYEGKVKVGKVNVDQQQELAAKFNVVSIPSLFIIKDGKLVNSTLGFVAKNKIEEMLNKVI